MRLEDRLRVYIDADVLLAGLARGNPQAASRGILEASELTLLDLVVGQRVLDECERNLSDLALEGAALEELRRSLQAAVSRTVEVVDDPTSLPSVEGADPKDEIHLACAVDHECDFLVTYNIGDYPRSYHGVGVVEPGTLVRRIREQIRELG